MSDKVSITATPAAEQEPAPAPEPQSAAPTPDAQPQSPDLALDQSEGHNRTLEEKIVSSSSAGTPIDSHEPNPDDWTPPSIQAGDELATSAAKSIMMRITGTSESSLVRRILSVDDYIVAAAQKEDAAIEAPAPETSAIVAAVAIPVPDHSAGITNLLGVAARTTAAVPKVSLSIARPTSPVVPDTNTVHSIEIQQLLTVAMSAATLSPVATIPAHVAPKPAIALAPAPAEQSVSNQPKRAPPPASAHARPATVGETPALTPEKPRTRTESIFHLPRKPIVAEPWPRRLLRYAGYAATVLALLVIFRFVDPPGSALMAWRWVNGTTVTRDWVPISSISPNLVRAVIVSEDWTFCDHHGVDVAAMQEAIEKAGDGIPRGASTISMQVVKNVFLWPSKSYVRKAIELPMTLVMEILWPKQRVLEVYLNVAEWGPGIFGAEAAARHHFNKPASRLTSREAAQLAASLPNPFVRDAGDPGPRLARKATTIQNRMRIAGGVTECVGVTSDAKAP